MAKRAQVSPYTPCFGGSPSGKFLISHPLPLTMGLSAKGWHEYFSFANVAVDERAKPVFDLGRFPVSSGELHVPVVFHAKDLPLRQRDAVGVAEKAKEHGFIKPTVESALLLAARMDPRELKELGIRWLIVMHHRVYAKELGRGFLALTEVDGKMTLTFCQGKKKWVEGAAFLYLALRQTSLATRTLNVQPELSHADPVY